MHGRWTTSFSKNQVRPACTQTCGLHVSANKTKQQWRDFFCYCLFSVHFEGFRVQHFLAWVNYNTYDIWHKQQEFLSVSARFQSLRNVLAPENKVVHNIAFWIRVFGVLWFVICRKHVFGAALDLFLDLFTCLFICCITSRTGTEVKQPSYWKSSSCNTSIDATLVNWCQCWCQSNQGN